MNKQPPKKSPTDPEKPVDATKSESPAAAPSTSEGTPTPTAASKVSPEEATTLTDAELEATLKALRAEVRRRESEREASRPRIGSKVRILRGRPKYVGKIGTAVIVRRSRCFVAVPDLNSPAYALISDLELLER
jgi:hypothetical protein